jgi:mRNA (guanine-N7-)-methyltransferase
MRAFNGWVKATQIAELDPDTSKMSLGKKRSRRSPLRVLDLACGKGGDLGKWTIHPRKMENYVGVDVARGSLIDAAIRARQMVQRGTLKRCTFSLADLGQDVPGRKRSKNAKRMQKLLTWNLESETSEEREYDPKFVMREGGGIAETDKFDVVSIQFAIHYMMSTRKRARRFFHTVSSLLEVGGNLIATTIDARVVVEKLMALGKDFHFDDSDLHEEVDRPDNASRHCDGNQARKVDDNGATVYAGDGVCRLKFDADVLRRIFSSDSNPQDMFGLEYTFTLVEGSDHSAGVGEAVDLPEWLTPIPALKELGEEAGLELGE